MKLKNYVSHALAYFMLFIALGFLFVFSLKAMAEDFLIESLLIGVPVALVCVNAYAFGTILKRLDDKK